MSSYYGKTDLTAKDVQVWELRVRLLELGERTLLAMGKEIKDAHDLTFMAVWIATLSNGILEQDVMKATHFDHDLHNKAKERFNIS
jgi:hypothetical protein